MDQAKKAYFVDGYHGGIKGHMPLGSWADVIRRLEQDPNWKLSLDTEPISWEALRRTDPRSYDAIKEYLQSHAGRVEMVAGSYAQPYGWVIGGESNIRQLIRGREVIQEHFPGIAVDTYASQEPCWSSSYPQILRSLGYKRTVLKNPGTGWGGYASGVNRETVLWVGPDGTSIPCVPRYECEELLNCWESEAGYMKPEFVEKCRAYGIAHPAGSFLQDLGWTARPWLNENYIQYTTWREYIEEIAVQPTEAWYFTQEDIRCTLPWGEGTLQRMSREVRAAEQAVVLAEKLASISSVTGSLVYPKEKLREAWDQLLLSQHHDAWICATTRTGREKWAWQAGTQSWLAEEIAGDIRFQAMNSMVPEPQDGIKPQAYGVRVFNASGIARKELTEIEVPGTGGTHLIRVLDADGSVIPSQLVPTRVSEEDGGIFAGKLIFEAETPAMGYRDYRLEHVKREDADTAGTPKENPVSVQICDDYSILTTDLYRIRIDIKRGGVVTELYDLTKNRSLVSPDQPFNELTGYLIAEACWASSMESPVILKVIENGPLRVAIEMNGQFAGTGFVMTLSAAKGQRRIDFHIRFRYEKDTWIGDPWEMAPENRSTERRKSHHNTRYKLQARFPIAIGKGKLYKNSAFDVTESRHSDTRYERWDEIKHNIILNWVDVYDEQSNCGLAIFSDHTTDYSHGDLDPLALTLGWGAEGGFWWGKRPLQDVREMRYAILPHEDRWDRAGIAHESERWTQPLQPMHIRWSKPKSLSLLHVSEPSIEISSLQRDGGDLLVRLYNSGTVDSAFSLVINAESSGISAVELDGKHKEMVQHSRLPNGGCEVGMTLPRHGLATLRISDIRYNKDETIGCETGIEYEKRNSVSD
ncbi:glycoside hydrolase family 38 C-terminal domain-containing protein [Paenibacillus sp. JDR-2]|uniref:glycoside hydrolase family 38 N-terminal domain-containing protein n=1 Tax=Paenibacillus sp. (strain JDR-2) TaxID=324057 RepID=UPI0001663D72|nr:glycoside hydrolase family 38 C-terminal domain-containing protein [Paenibacillus sp. JDR-2]ACT02827.1 glycosyl hydrolase 38 domain protein [Paenibacillus sp. JDR-2]